ncbi:MAG: hypothetical protein ACYSU5_23045 [Planctomycetota bacterium]|jgi:hypothetical protein
MRNYYMIAAAVFSIICVTGLRAEEIPNLAPKAKVSASSEYSGDYLARWAIDGKIPELESKIDTRQAWCVRGQKGMHGQFTLTWPGPVDVTEIVYFGRTGMIVQECFKDYEVYLDNSAEPVKKGVFEMRHGPQRILSIPGPRRSRYSAAHPATLSFPACSLSPTSAPLNQLCCATICWPDGWAFVIFFWSSDMP